MLSGPWLGFNSCSGWLPTQPTQLRGRWAADACVGLIWQADCNPIQREGPHRPSSNPHAASSLQ